MITRTLADPVIDANRHKQGIGAFNVVLLEHAEAIAQGAERAGRPVIFQISQNCVDYHGALAPVGARRDEHDLLALGRDADVAHRLARAELFGQRIDRLRSGGDRRQGQRQHARTRSETTGIHVITSLSP